MSSDPVFTVEALAEKVRGKLVGNGGTRIRGLAPLAEAGPEELSLFADPRYRAALERTRAGALVTRETLSSPNVPQIVVDEPFLALARLVDLFYPRREIDPGIHSSAHVSESAHIGGHVRVAPFAHVGDGARVGDRTVLHCGVFVGEGSSIGDDCVLWPNVVVRDGCRLGSRVTVHPGAVIGADGFGFARTQGKFSKIRHVGTVVVEDDVEIGANAAIDRGTLGRTLIRRGVKIDNLVHIAHNVEVGEDSAMAAQVGISGSTVIGKRVLMGGQVGVVDHLTIGDGAMLIAQSGVIGNVPAGATVSGYPARDHREVLKAAASLRRIERLRKELRELERRLNALENPKRGAP